MTITKLKDAKVFSTSTSTEELSLTHDVEITNVVRNGRTKINTTNLNEGETSDTYWIPTEDMPSERTEVPEVDAECTNEEGNTLDEQEATPKVKEEAISDIEKLPVPDIEEEAASDVKEKDTEVLIVEGPDNRKENDSKEYYTVRRGDTAQSIAHKFNISIAELDKLNNGSLMTPYYLGRRIRVR